jgi:ATP-dependent Lon protease
MEVISLSGYIAQEKLQIGRKYLLPRQLKQAGLKRGDVTLDNATLRAIIDGYARDPGVRRLEKQLARIVRKAVVRILDGAAKPMAVTKTDLKDYLGNPVFRDERRLTGAGVVTGLAWTAMGGATLSIEAVRIHGYTRGFKLTGQLGDVMKESAEIAYSYVASHCADFGADPEYFKDAFVHLHVPAGATPKDGPSAGITMASALLSLARGEPVRKIAMTGELTLTGQVFPVGGIREKVIAARRAGIRELILPADNQGEYEEIPAHVREGFTVHFAQTFADVAGLLFAKRTRPSRAQSKSARRV